MKIMLIIWFIFVVINHLDKNYIENDILENICYQTNNFTVAGMIYVISGLAKYIIGMILVIWGIIKFL